MPPAKRPNITTPTDELTALRAEVAGLRARLAAVEAERDEFAEHNAELFVLQQVFSTLNSTMAVDDILATVLRGILQAMEFRRVVLLEVVDGTAVRRLETDASGMVEPSSDPSALTETPTLRALIDGRLEFANGPAGDGENPLGSFDGSFCMLPLTSRETVRGVLYVDRPDPAELGEIQLRMLLDFAAQAAVAMENARLYAETRRLLEETERLASTDALTGLSNRRAMDEMVDREIANARRYGNRLALILLDLDDLKRINDRGGHRAGDEALQAFAHALRSGARRGDLVARYGGDEFVLLMGQCDRLGAEAVLTRLYAVLAARSLRCSAGVALFPAHGPGVAALFEAADRALYAAKLAGKNCYRLAHAPI